MAPTFRFPTMAVLLAFSSFLILLPEASAVRYIVGSGLGGWSPNVNFTVWARGKHFYLGDWLYFVYDRNQQSILEVNKTDYETCNTDHPVANWTRGAGRDVVPLNVTKLRYFVSGNGFCYSGMKLAIETEKAPPPPPASPVKAAASAIGSACRAHVVLPLVFGVGAAWDGLLRVT